MRALPSNPQSPQVQFLLEIERDGDARVAGEVTAAGGHPTPFSGWLELLRLLEEGLHDPTEQTRRQET
jgi:hypothetical protein